MGSISALPKDQKPRERLMHHGAGALADYELLAILLGSGTPKNDVLSLARLVLNQIDVSNGSLSCEGLCAVNGVGPARAAVIMAALEFARRRLQPKETIIQEPADVFRICGYLCDRKQEHVVAITLNGANEVIASRVVTIGLVNRAQIHPREVYADAVCDRASSIIVAHNYPSGQLEPSKEDLRITEDLKAAGRILGIPLVDHVIFSVRGFYSFREQGKLGEP
jgi:DNA repair protein RadC